MRKGEVGGYDEYLSPDDIAYITKKMHEELPSFFGYTEGLKQASTKELMLDRSRL
jgi:hypothetical protein